MPDGIVTIRKGREKPIHNQHPWVFSGSITRAENAAPGDLVRVVNHQGDFLAQGYWNPNSTIQVRLLAWDETPINADWWRTLLKRAIQNRKHRIQPGTAQRLIHAENDFLPGLIVDRYGDWLVLQALTMHIDQHKADIAGYLVELLKDMQLPVAGVYERSDVDVREREGLPESAGLLLGDEPPEHIQISEAQGDFYVDVRNGHKTGFYLDQQTNREQLYHLLMQSHSGERRRLLNTFCYTGGFAISGAAAGDVHAVNVDTSADVLELAEANWHLNNLDAHSNQAEFVQADVFDYLRDTDGQFDVIVLDPPKFAHHKGQVQSAARGYKDINLNAFQRVKPGGYLMTFSCSGAIGRDLFQKIVFGALADSGRQAQIVQLLNASADHPIALTFPEGEYLTGLLLRVF